WELGGEKPKSIAVHSGYELTVIDPEKKKAEVINTTDDDDDSRSRLAAFFDLSVPQTWEAFEQNLLVTSLERDRDTWVAHLMPKDRKQIRGVKALAFRLDDDCRQLLAFTLKFRDGSTLESVFTKIERNTEVDASLFEVSLDGYSVKRKSG
ncbi:MAG: hypothetical protein AAF585_28920, partial [Verrucomicrobiota bacterium]